MTIALAPICHECARLDKSDRPLRTRARCDAFPDGIPDAILVDGFDHRRPFPGDNGIQFEPANSGAPLQYEPPPEDELQEMLDRARDGRRA